MAQDDVQLQSFPQINAPFVQEKTWQITAEWRYLLQSLWFRTGKAQGVVSASVKQTADDALANADAAQLTANDALASADAAQLTADDALTVGNDAFALANTSVQKPDAVAGYTASTGTGSRAGLDMNWGTFVSNPPTQAQVQSIADQLQAVTKLLGQLENDQLTIGTIKL